MAEEQKRIGEGLEGRLEGVFDVWERIAERIAFGPGVDRVGHTSQMNQKPVSSLFFLSVTDKRRNMKSQ